MSEPKEKRCYCPRCKWDSHIRGVIRRGEKYEMRAMIRELHEANIEMAEELEMAEAHIHHLTCHEDHEPKREIIN